MPRLLRCPQGHQWEPLPDDPTVSGGALCPEYGQLEQAITACTYAGNPSGSSGPETHPHLEAYEILEEVGRGGMGIVFKARHRESGRLVALKIIRKDRLSNAEAVARFRREARAAARLSHPNIVLLHEADQEGDVHYLAMEFVPGVTLQAHVEAHGPLPVDLACDLLRQTALGLQHAHEQSLIHRDIKPANLMIVDRGSWIVNREDNPTAALRSTIHDPRSTILKILDMGVARLYQLQHEASITTLTQHGAVIGTPDYIAPEQVENPHLADIRADLYSLGCTAYLLLTGDVPFWGGSLIQKLDRQRWEVPPAVDQLRKDVPPQVAAVVRRLMAKNPDERFQTPGELADALEELARTGHIAALKQRTLLTPSARLTGHNGPVLGLAFLGDSQHLVSGGRDRTLRIWKVTEEKQVRHLDMAREVAAVAAWGTNVLVAAGVGVRLFDALSGDERQRFSGHLNAVRSGAFSPDGKLAASGGDDQTARLWDVQTGRAVQKLTKHADSVTAVAFSPEGRLLVSAGRDQALLLWDVRSGRLGREYPVPRGAVTGAAFCADGRHVVSAHFDTTLRLWDHESAREMRRLQGHKQMVTVVACSSAGRIASGGNDRTLRLWDADSGSETTHGEGHT